MQRQKWFLLALLSTLREYFRHSLCSLVFTGQKKHCDTLALSDTLARHQTTQKNKTHSSEIHRTHMRLACPLTIPGRRNVTSDIKLNHRHAYLHHDNLLTKNFNKPHRTRRKSLKPTTKRNPKYYFLESYKCCKGL